MEEGHRTNIEHRTLNIEGKKNGTTTTGLIIRLEKAFEVEGLGGRFEVSLALGAITFVYMSTQFCSFAVVVVPKLDFKSFRGVQGVC